jgi:hypothetical protein
MSAEIAETSKGGKNLNEIVTANPNEGIKGLKTRIRFHLCRGRKTGARVRVRARASPEVVSVAVMEEEARPRVLARCCKGRAWWLVARWWCARHGGGSAAKAQARRGGAARHGRDVVARASEAQCGHRRARGELSRPRHSGGKVTVEEHGGAAKTAS